MKKITALRAEGGRKKRIGVYLDGRPVFKLEAEVALKENLKVGQELSEEALSVLARLNLYSRTLKAATNYLSYRPRSEFEVKERLRRRGFAECDIEAVIARLKEQGLVDDVAFAEFWRENRASFSPRSRYLTSLELRRKGVSSEVAETATGALDDGESAYRAALPRALRLSLSDYQGFRRRLGGYLRRRGFAYDVINPTLARLWQELRGKTS